MITKNVYPKRVNEECIRKCKLCSKQIVCVMERLPGSKTSKGLKSYSQLIFLSKNGVYVEINNNHRSGSWLCNECYLPILHACEVKL